MVAGIGHNHGPTLERGQKWRAFQWRRAREKAMPNTMPLMIVRMRVARAAELGISYKSYAAIRQATGRDILALLFSSNALRVFRADTPQIPEPETSVIEAVTSARKLALLHKPLQPDNFLDANPQIQDANPAPKFTDSWAEMSRHLSGFVQQQKIASDQVLIIGDTHLERDWTTAARAAGYLAADSYFPQRN